MQMVHHHEKDMHRSASLGDLETDRLPQGVMNGKCPDSADRPSRGGGGGGHSRQHSLGDIDVLRLNIEDDDDTAPAQKHADEEDDHHRLLLPSAIQSSLPRPVYSFREDVDGIGMRILAKTRLQKSFILANMMLPTLTMVVCLFGLGSIWAAALSFHVISCILVPSVYMVSVIGVDGCLKAWASFAVHVRIQLMAGMVYCIAGVCVCVCACAFVCMCVCMHIYRHTQRTHYVCTYTDTHPTHT
jgi:hypothetical protein